MFSVVSWRQKVVVDRSSLSSVGSLFHARGAATEKALSPIRRRVCKELQRSIDGTDRHTDTVPLHRPCRQWQLALRTMNTFVCQRGRQTDRQTDRKAAINHKHTKRNSTSVRAEFTRDLARFNENHTAAPAKNVDAIKRGEWSWVLCPVMGHTSDPSTVLICGGVGRRRKVGVGLSRVTCVGGGVYATA